MSQGDADQLAEALLALRTMRARIDALERAKPEPIAIVGIGCRFPGGASDPERQPMPTMAVASPAGPPIRSGSGSCCGAEPTRSRPFRPIAGAPSGFPAPIPRRAG